MDAVDSCWFSDDTGMAQACQPLVWDRRLLTEDERTFVAAHGATVLTDNATADQQVSMQEFVAQCDCVLCSAAVDISSLLPWAHKLISEVDLFQSLFNHPLIAITGTIGKTSLTQLTAELLSAGGQRVLVGGNIGSGLLDLSADAKPCDLAVVELSSFQLEHNRTFSPDIAVITNLYPNHLDRHHTFAAYCAAKYNLFNHARPGQRLIVPITLANDAQCSIAIMKSAVTPLFIASTAVSAESLANVINLNGSLLECRDGAVWHRTSDDIANKRGGRLLLSRTVIPAEGFLDNWLSVIGVLMLSQGDLTHLTSNLLLTAWHTAQAKVGQHRLEHCGSVGSVDLFNDSKATVTESVRAAIAQLALRYPAITLIIGGLGKGIDRRPAFQSFIEHPAVNAVIAVGQAPDLVGTHRCLTLDDAVPLAISLTPPGGAVLLSPGGTSFDQFTNYEHRGMVFKQLVANHRQTLPR